MKSIDYFNLSIETKLSKVRNLNVHFFRIGSILSASSGNYHIARQQMNKKINLELPKLQLYQLTKNLDSKIVPCISSALIYLGVIIDKSILSISPILACVYH